MRVPQVSERIKEAPAQALRGVFAGIGQLLLITDKVRHKAPAEVPPARTLAAAETTVEVTASKTAGQRAQTAEPTRATAPPAGSTSAESTTAASVPGESVITTSASAKPAAGRDFDKTGNVRLIREGEATAATPGSSVAQRQAEAPATEDNAEAPATESKTEAPAPPLPNYDELSIASLRARLRSLNVSQVRELAAYEKTHAGRPDVISMFERRIVKLEAETKLEGEPEAGG